MVAYSPRTLLVLAAAILALVGTKHAGFNPSFFLAEQQPQRSLCSEFACADDNEESDYNHEQSSLATTTLDPSSNLPWSCRPSKHRHAKIVRRHTPVIIFAKARTGSNLLSTMLQTMHGMADDRQDLTLTTYGELFQPATIHSDLTLQKLKDAITAACPPGWGYRIAKKIHAQRMQDPGSLLKYLSGLPAPSEQAYFAFKVFDRHLEKMTKNQTVSSFVEIANTNRPKYIVLWRRHVLESFVSHRVAEESGQWTKLDTSKIRVHVDKTQLEDYMAAEYSYYKSVKTALEDTSDANWMVIEYDRDLKDGNSQRQTLRRLAAFLEIEDSVNVNAVLRRIALTKQATVPLSQQVTNWQDVVEWGYGSKELEDWEDLFPATNEH